MRNPADSRHGALRGVTRRRLLAIAGGAGLASLTAGVPLRTPAPPSVVALSSTTSAGVMLCRQAWGARPALPGGRAHTVTRMTIHHSAVTLPDNREIIARLQQHQRFHQDDRGWVDIAYHAAVDRRGNIFALRDPAIAGDTATDYDTTGHFLILCEGNFDTETVTDEQLDGAALVCAWATRRFGIGVDTLSSHREVTAVTSCPGADLENRLVSGDLTQRITGLIDSGFELRSICGSEADARVAGIEAGR